MRFLYTAPLGLILLAFFGCSEATSGPALVPAEGVVTLDGKPLAGVQVMFDPQGETRGQRTYGKTDAEGKFAIAPPAGRKGTPAGEYRVVMSKLVKPDGSDFIPDPKSGPEDTGGFRELLPPAYSDPAQTQLRAEIPAGGTKSLEFKLNSKAR
jgi:hypothetical protein